MKSRVLAPVLAAGCIIMFLAVILNAQPIALSRGTHVTLIMGSGTPLMPGTKLSGEIVDYTKDYLRFMGFDGQTYRIQWSHIAAVNGVSISTHTIPPPTPPGETVNLNSQAVAVQTGSFPPDQGLNSASFGRFALQLEYLVPSNIYNDAFNQVQQSASKSPFDATPKLSINAGKPAGGAGGVKVEFLHPVSDRISLGAAVNYVYTPPYQILLSGTSVSLPVNYAFTQHLQYLLVLAESQINFPLSLNWTAHLGAGFGFGTVMSSQQSVCTGSGCGNASVMPLGAFRNSSTAPTWEASLGLTYRQLMMGLTAIGLPDLQANSFTGIGSHWATGGGYVGWIF